MFEKMLTPDASILVVDDEVTTRATLKARLGKKDGHQIFEATNGGEALEQAKKWLPNIIILDWKMPDFSGIEVLRALRAEEKTKHIPVFMLTSKNLVSDVEIAFEMGAVEYLSKPLELDLISGKIQSYLQSIKAAV